MSANSLSDPGGSKPPGSRRIRRPASWSTVLALLLITGLGMLFAIYWVVHTAKL